MTRQNICQKQTADSDVFQPTVCAVPLCVSQFNFVAFSLLESRGPCSSDLVAKHFDISF